MNEINFMDIALKHQKWLNGEEGGERANLCGSRFGTYRIVDQNFSELDLSESLFIDTLMSKVQFVDSKLDHAIFMNTNFSNVDFSGANLTSASFHCAYFSNVKFCGATLDNLDTTNAVFINCDFRGIKMSPGFIRGSRFYGAIFHEGNIFDDEFPIIHDNFGR